MKLNTSCRQVQDASDGALLFISFIDQPDAALPYVAVRMRQSGFNSLILWGEAGFCDELGAG